MPRYALLIVLAGLLIAVPAALANHIPGHACSGCASHEEWPTINGKFKKANGGQSPRLRGQRRNDELLGHHGSDTLSGRGGSDVLWGDHDPAGQPAAPERPDLRRRRQRLHLRLARPQRDLRRRGQRRDLRPLRARRSSTAGPAATSTTSPARARRATSSRNCEKVDYRPETPARRRAEAAALVPARGAPREWMGGGGVPLNRHDFRLEGRWERLTGEMPLWGGMTSVTRRDRGRAGEIPSRSDPSATDTFAGVDAIRLNARAVAITLPSSLRSSRWCAAAP